MIAMAIFAMLLIKNEDATIVATSTLCGLLMWWVATDIGWTWAYGFVVGAIVLVVYHTYQLVTDH